MTVIDSYLDTLFAPYPDTPRLREARTELRTMMEDQQDGLMEEGLTESQAVGRVIADFGSLEEVAPVLGIDTELGRAAALPQEPPAPALGADRARTYIDTLHRTQWIPATGLALFVLSAAPLMLLIAATSAAPAEDPAGWAIAAGIAAVLVMVAAGLLLMMVHGALLKDYEDITEGDFTASAEVVALAQDLRRRRSRAVTIASATAIVLWVLSALPVILTALLSADGSLAPLYGVSLTLVMVAAGLAIMARAGWSDTATEALLQQEEFDEDSPAHSESPAIRAIAALYWPVMAAIYLAWSFLSDDWEITWVLWPVAGVLYGGLHSLSAALRRDDRAQHAGTRRR